MNFRGLVALLFVIIAKTAIAPSQALDSAQPTALSICALLRSPQNYDGRPVVISGKVEASFESTVIYDPQCGGMHLSGWAGGKGVLSEKLESAIITRTGQFDIQIKTTVEGVFHAKVAIGNRSVRTLELLRVDDVRLTGTQQSIPSGPKMTDSNLGRSKD